MATVLSRAQYGMDAPLVRVEVDLGSGLPAFAIVGLPEAVVKESKDRVRAALTNCNFEFPHGRITVNLAPADLPKEGGRFDLPIALGILLAAGQLPANALANCEFYGELSLGGEVRSVKGALVAALAAARAGHALFLPSSNGTEASLASGCQVAAADHLLQVTAHLTGTSRLTFAMGGTLPAAMTHHHDLADVRGQAHAKRALEVAAAGEHSLLLMGPPGTGKSMLAQRLPGILPPMTDHEALESAAVRTLLGNGINLKEWRLRPFRSPHHTASAAALVGGGKHPRPGEISLAHHGVLFLDELPEFDRRALEVLREPMETGVISIARAAAQAEFPARFQLVCAMNPCKCGCLGDPTSRCRCTSAEVQRYRGRLSGPLLDRIDLQVEVPRLPTDSLLSTQRAEASATVAARVVRARELQVARQGGNNSRLTTAAIEEHCQPDARGRVLLERALTSFGLSARGYHRVLKVARTIADLAQAETITAVHIGEALQLRKLDRR
jgi:magnesium chelatase family protein